MLDVQGTFNLLRDELQERQRQASTAENAAADFQSKREQAASKVLEAERAYDKANKEAQHHYDKYKEANKLAQKHQRLLDEGKDSERAMKEKEEEMLKTAAEARDTIKQIRAQYRPAKNDAVSAPPMSGAEQAPLAVQEASENARNSATPGMRHDGERAENEARPEEIKDEQRSAQQVFTQSQPPTSSESRTPSLSNIEDTFNASPKPDKAKTKSSALGSTKIGRDMDNSLWMDEVRKLEESGDKTATGRLKRKRNPKRLPNSDDQGKGKRSKPSGAEAAAQIMF